MHVPTIEFTAALAEHAHRGQFDKAGKPYIDHPRAVAKALEPHGEYAVMAGWLHDVVEDSPITLAMLSALGYPIEVIKAVNSVTRRDDENYLDLINRAAADPLGCVVKMADNRHNFGRLDNLSPGEAARLSKRYTRAYEILEAAHKARNAGRMSAETLDVTVTGQWRIV